MAKLTVKNVLEALDRAVEKKGADYVYPWEEGCTYADGDGNPSCIVGYVLADLDPNLFEEFKESEHLDGGFGIGSADGYTRNRPTVERPIIDVLAVAQRAQDTGFTWGVAAQVAKDYVKGELA